MNKENLSYADVEQLLTELAQHDLRASAQDEAQTELMRGAARGEIRRVFRRRRCLRVAGSMTVLGLLGVLIFQLQPEGGMETSLAKAPMKPGLSHAAAQLMPRSEEQGSARGKGSKGQPAGVGSACPAPLECGSDLCDVVIYSVPL